MTITVKEYTVYTIDSHPNPELCYEWIRNNWHDLGEHCVQEAIDSLKAFADHIGATLDYSVSIVPDRGEHISLDHLAVIKDDLPAIDLSGNCPFTGVYYDEVILDAFRDEDENGDDVDTILRDVEYRVLKAIHSEGEHIYSDDGLREMCEANEYEFNADGEIN